MGYWNGWGSYAEWFYMNKNEIDYPKCKYCGERFLPTNARQKYCTHDQSPECFNDRYYDDLWKKGRHPLQLMGLSERSAQ